MIKVPKTCLICGSPWAGGHERPGKQMQPWLRVFYGCGASISYKILADGIYQLLIKNCQNDEGEKCVRKDVTRDQMDCEARCNGTRSSCYGNYKNCPLDIIHNFGRGRLPIAD